MKKINDKADGDKPIVQRVIDTSLYPVRVATSPILLRTYLHTALLFLTSTILFGFAVIAYMSFYYSYIPVRGISVPVYLHFDHGTSSSYLGAQAGSILGARWPSGVASLYGLVDRQKYDVVAKLDVPRSETNLEIGNWMLELELRGPSANGGGVMSFLGLEDQPVAEEHDQKKAQDSSHGSENKIGKQNVLACSRRPALLTYRSHLVGLAHRILRLPWYLIGWHTESEHIEVSMMESIMFEQGQSNIPSSLRLEIRSRQPLEVYRVTVQISAKLEGLRWLMYRYWLTSAAVGIGMFWSVETGVLLFTWAIFTLLFGKSSGPNDHESKPRTKSDPEPITPKLEPAQTEPGTPFSDTSRTFPTLPSQQPLSYTSPKEERSTPNLEDIPMKEEAEADDEDDDYVLEEPMPLRAGREGVFTDSGIGTSLEETPERGLARRRSGRRKDDAGY